MQGVEAGQGGVGEPGDAAAVRGLVERGSRAVVWIGEERRWRRRFKFCL